MEGDLSKQLEEMRRQNASLLDQNRALQETLARMTAVQAPASSPVSGVAVPPPAGATAHPPTDAPQRISASDRRVRMRRTNSISEEKEEGSHREWIPEPVMAINEGTSSSICQWEPYGASSVLQDTRSGETNLPASNPQDGALSNRSKVIEKQVEAERKCIQDNEHQRECRDDSHPRQIMPQQESDAGPSIRPESLNLDPTTECVPRVRSEPGFHAISEPVQIPEGGRRPPPYSFHDPVQSPYSQSPGHLTLGCPPYFISAEGQSILNQLSTMLGRVSTADPVASSTRTMLDRLEQLVAENSELRRMKVALEEKIGEMNTYIGHITQEREEIWERCQVLEGKLAAIGTRGERERENLEAQSRHARHEAEHWRHQYESLDKVREELQEQIKAMKALSSSSQSLDQVHVVESGDESPECDRAMQRISDGASSPLSRFHVERGNVLECRLCLQTYRVDENGDDCYYHPSRPLHYNEWKVMLPHEAQDPSKQTYKLYYCCWKLAKRRPPGCTGPRRHEPLHRQVAWPQVTQESHPDRKPRRERFKRGSSDPK